MYAQYHFSGILGIFAKLQKATNIHHVCLSVRTEKLDSTERIFTKFGI